MNSNLKKGILGFFLVAVSVLFWLFVKQILFQSPDGVKDHFWSLDAIGIFSALLLLYGTMLTLVVFLISDGVWAHGILFAGALPYGMVAPSRSYELLGAFIVLWGTFFLLREWVYKENKNRIELAVDKTVPQNLTWAFTALALSVAVAFYVSPAVKQLKDIKIPREFFQKLVAPMEFAFQQGIQTSVQSFIGTPEKSMPIEAARNLTPEQREKLLELARPFTEPPTAGSGIYSEFSDALYNAFNNQIARTASLSPATERVISLSLAMGLFASIRILVIPIGWLVIVLSMIIVNIMTYIGFIKVGTLQVEKETIEL